MTSALRAFVLWKRRGVEVSGPLAPWLPTPYIAHVNFYVNNSAGSRIHVNSVSVCVCTFECARACVLNYRVIVWILCFHFYLYFFLLVPSLATQKGYPPPGPTAALWGNALELELELEPHGEGDNSPRQTQGVQSDAAIPGSARRTGRVGCGGRGGVSPLGRGHCCCCCVQ